MHDKTPMKDFLEKAGFVFWGAEPWGPGEGEIDWACDYTDEFKKFAELLMAHIEKTCQTVQEADVLASTEEYDIGRKMGAEVLKNYLISSLR